MNKELTPAGEESHPVQDASNVIGENAPKETAREGGPTHGTPKISGRVCITYGRDQIMNRQVVSLIRAMAIDPIVMQDKHNSAKPLAQFVSENKDIAFVIAILSADDWAYAKNSKPQNAMLYASPRVVFHLGYWIGKLGRSRVFALYYDQRSFRWPTEHFDVIYTPLDKNDSWKKELAQRLKDCHIEIPGEIR